MKKQKTWWSLSLFVVAVSLVLAVAFVGCDSNGAGDSDGTPTPGTGDATLEDGDSFRSVKVTVDGDSSWFEVIDGSVTGTSLSATITRASDDADFEGKTLTVSFTQDAANNLTFSNDTLGLSATGRLSLDGETYMLRDTSLTDGSEGSVQLGIAAATAATNTTLNGDYFVAIVHSDTAQSEGFFTGAYSNSVYMNFNAGTILVTGAPSTDGTLHESADYSNNSTAYDYTISSTGELTVDPNATIFPRPLVGQARADGELFILADTRTDPPMIDNSVKTVFIGIKKHPGEDDLLAGTWDFGDLYSGYESGDAISWDESASTMTFDAAGDGTWTTGTDTGTVSIDLATDGSFSLPTWNTVGAVTASGDVMVMLTNQILDGDYYLSIGIKTP